MPTSKHTHRPVLLLLPGTDPLSTKLPHINHHSCPLPAAHHPQTIGSLPQPRPSGAPHHLPAGRVAGPAMPVDLGPGHLADLVLVATLVAAVGPGHLAGLAVLDLALVVAAVGPGHLAGLAVLDLVLVATVGPGHLAGLAVLDLVLVVGLALLELVLVVAGVGPGNLAGLAMLDLLHLLRQPDPIQVYARLVVIGAGRSVQ